MKITPNFETNHTELTFTRASHTTNIEKLAQMYVNHLSTLDYHSLKIELNKEPAKKIIDPRKRIIDLLPFTKFDEAKKYYNEDQFNKNYNGFKPRYEMPNSKDVFFDIFEVKKFNQERFFKANIRKLLPLLEEPAIQVTVQDGVSPAYGFPGSPGFIDLNNWLFKTNENRNTVLIDHTIAHEKGHGLRIFEGYSLVTRAISECLDSNAFLIGKKDRESRIASCRKNNYSEQEIESMMENFEKIDMPLYYMMPHEIMERMAQLKNYFGFSSPYDVFTLEHLNYARTHYVQDFGYMGEIQMFSFLEAITRERESHFLKMINELPI